MYQMSRQWSVIWRSTFRSGLPIANVPMNDYYNSTNEIRKFLHTSIPMLDNNKSLIITNNLCAIHGCHEYPAISVQQINEFNFSPNLISQQRFQEGAECY